MDEGRVRWKGAGLAGALTYQTAATIEEAGEMSGKAVFPYAPLNDLQRRIGPITVNLS